MDLLGIKELRRGADGDVKSPFAANYDESKADVYPTLPDPLLLKNGKRVTTANEWWTKRRPEIVEDFDREIYGRVPANLPKVTWEVVSTTPEKNADVAVITKRLLGHVDNSSYPAIKVDIDLTLTTPANANSLIGAYPIVAAGQTATNYSIRYVNGILTVLPAPALFGSLPAGLGESQWDAYLVDRAPSAGALSAECRPPTPNERLCAGWPVCEVRRPACEKHAPAEPGQ